METITPILTEVYKMLKIRRPITIINQHAETHPDNTSMLAISDILHDSGIQNEGLYVGFNDLYTIPTPFIVFSSENKFLLIKSVNKNKIIYWDDAKKNVQINPEQFSQVYTGYLLTIKSDSKDIKKINLVTLITEYLKTRSTFIGTLLLLSILLFHIASILSTTQIPEYKYALLLVTKLAGLFTSILLMAKSFGNNGNLFRKICNGKKLSCNSILSSNAAKILGNYLTWSDIGLLYYSSTLCALVLTPSTKEILFMIAIINLASLPYSFFSIYYQYYTAKKWCIFCLSIQLLLWIEFFIHIPFPFSESPRLSTDQILSFIKLTTIPIAVWMIIKPFILSLGEINTIKRTLRLFKNNFNIFNTLTFNQERHTLLDKNNSIILGNNGSLIVSLISNPDCSHCKDAYKTLDEIKKRSNNFTLQIVFSTNDESNKTASFLFFLSTRQDDQDLNKAILFWSENRQQEFDDLLLKYQSVDLGKYGRILSAQNKWCKQLPLKHTPSILINGYMVPDQYEPKDIKYFILNYC